MEGNFNQNEGNNNMGAFESFNPFFYNELNANEVLQNIEEDDEGDDEIQEIERPFIAPTPQTQESVGIDQQTSGRGRGRGRSGPSCPSGGGRGRGGRGGRELKSDIMTVHYTKTPVENAPNQFKIKCNYCEKSYDFTKGGGYGTASGHLKRNHPDKLAALERSQSQLQFTPQNSQGASSSTLFKFSESNYRSGLAKLVSGKGLSFSFASDKLWEIFAKFSLNPSARKVSRQSLTRDVGKVWREYKLKMIQDFSKMENKVSICSDIWSDHWQHHSYIGVTCHWVDKSWTIQKRLIALRDFDTEHSAQNIANKLLTILNEYNLIGKVYSMGFDNASANTASLPELVSFCQPSIGGKYFHVRCICHILNLCVQDFLDSMDPKVGPVRKATAYIGRYTSIQNKWLRFCKSRGVKEIRFSPDVTHRWNSTYRMLSQSIGYKEEICAFLTSIGYRETIFPFQWDACSGVLEILKVFKDATVGLSGIYYPTSDLVMDHCINVSIVFSEFWDDDIVGGAIREMRVKWLKYFQEIPRLFLVAKVLDPRIRLKGLEEMLQLYYDNLFHDEGEGAYYEIIKKIVKEVEKDLNIMVKEYQTTPNPMIPIPPSGGPPIRSGGGVPVVDIGCGRLGKKNWTERMYGTNKRPRVPNSSSNKPQEFEDYISTTFEPFPENLNVLKWWSKRGTSFGILPKIAKEVLASPASTVAVEQIFSQTGNTLDPTRSRLTVENLENQMCVGDSYRADIRDQEEKWSSDEDFGGIGDDGSSGCESNECEVEDENEPLV